MAEERAPETKLSPRAEVALELVGVVKTEIVARVRIRDTLLAGYSAAAITTFAAVSTSATLGNNFLYVVPYLALAFTILVSYHQAGIGALGRHCATDLLEVLEKETGVRGFELSNIFYMYHGKASTRRSIAHLIILLLPPAWALWKNIADLYTVFPATLPWLAGFAAMVIATGIIWRANRPHFHGVAR